MHLNYDENLMVVLNFLVINNNNIISSICQQKTFLSPRWRKVPTSRGSEGKSQSLPGVCEEIWDSLPHCGGHDRWDIRYTGRKGGVSG